MLRHFPDADLKADRRSGGEDVEFVVEHFDLKQGGHV
jgi:hypothetical protein